MQETMQAYLIVTAPFDGVITDRNVHPGALVSRRVERFEADAGIERSLSSLRLQVDIPENLLGTMKVRTRYLF